MDPPYGEAMGRGTVGVADGGGAAPKPLRQRFALPPPHACGTGRIDVSEIGLGAAAMTLAGVMARVAGWRPDDFWMATPADVAAVLAAWAEEGAEARVGRGELAAMMEAYPDG